MTLQERENLTDRLIYFRAMVHDRDLGPPEELLTGIIDAIIQIIGPLPEPEPWSFDDPEERAAIQEEPAPTGTYYLLRHPRL